MTYDKLQKQYSHEIIGPLQQGIGVCEGIAKTVKLFCDRLGIDCLIAVSEADPEHGVRYRHAWNLVKIGGSWLHLDATFDNSLKRYGTKRYDYYNLEDRQLFPGPSAADRSGAGLHEKRRLLLPGEPPFPHQDRGGGQTAESSSEEKAALFCVSLAGRGVEPLHSGGNLKGSGSSRSGQGKACAAFGECASGCDPGEFRGPACRGEVLTEEAQRRRRRRLKDGWKKDGCSRGKTSHTAG